MTTTRTRTLVNELEESAELIAELDVEGIWRGLLAEAVREWERLERTGLAAAEIEKGVRAFLEGLSDKPLDVLARHGAGVSYNEGRDVAFQEAKESGEARYVVRTEVLDEKTCHPCALLDGAVYEIDSDDYWADMPPAHCEGGDNCRGFYIAVEDGGGS